MVTTVTDDIAMDCPELYCSGTGQRQYWTETVLDTNQTGQSLYSDWTEATGLDRNTGVIFNSLSYISFSVTVMSSRNTNKMCRI
jgi:hypothetical protein